MRAIRWRGWWIPALTVLLSLLAISGTAVAHPMGNFSINHYAKIRVRQSNVEILYLVDMAEIPTFQDMRQFGFGVQPESPGALRYLDGQAMRFKEGLTVEVDGQAVTLNAVSQDIVFSDGAGGLPTMKLSFVFREASELLAGTHRLSYADNNFPGRAGWKEIVALGEGVPILESTVPAVDRSDELSVYSTDSLSSPPQQLTAVVTLQTDAPLARPGKVELRPALAEAAPEAAAAGTASMDRAPAAGKSGGASSVAPASSSSNGRQSGALGNMASTIQSIGRAQNTPRSSFTELISTRRKLGFWFLMTAAVIAMALGALHAFEPGHGKTIVAAYLVGSRGTPSHAVLLGLVVTAAHTAGVYLLGVLTLYASRYVVPENLYPWLGAISGLSVSGVGILVFLRHLAGASGEHAHASGERHSHWLFSIFKQRVLQKPESDSQAASPQPAEGRAPSLRELCTLGISGGIVPCPAALVVLLSAFSLHRVGFGLFLITGFSVGLAVVLVIVGLTMVCAKRWMMPRLERQRSIVRHLPLLSSALMAFLGVGIAFSSFSSALMGRVNFFDEGLLPFIGVTLLGLFLGMRHATDPDHVVAVSTIVSRQKSIRSSAMIGLLWGLGHTLTIFLVGSAIIILGVVIPPRLGLSMEFCVALMLVLLGVLNLTGILSWISERSTPGENSIESTQEKIDTELSSVPSSRWAPLPAARAHSLGLYQTLRPFVVGLVHGLAGSAAVALLVLSTIKDPLWSTAYLLLFGCGTMLGMMLMTAAISAPLVVAGRRFSALHQRLTAISGFASVAFGMFLVYHIGFVDGLFTAHVHWIPQ